MSRKILRIVIGTAFCLVVLSVLSSRPANAFDFFGLLKPAKKTSSGKMVAHGKIISPAGFYGINKVTEYQNNFDLNFHLDGGEVTGSFNWNYGRREVDPPLVFIETHRGNLTGNYSGGEAGSFQGKFTGNITNMINGEIRGDYSGSVSGTWTAEMITEQKIRGYLKFLKHPTGEIKQPSFEVTFNPQLASSPTLAISPSPSPSPQPGEKRKLKLVDFEGKVLTNGKAVVQLTDGTREEVEVKNGEVVYDSGLIKKITVKDLDNPDKKLTLQPGDLESGEVVIGTQEEWLEYIMPRLEILAKILNDGEEIDLSEYFKIDPNADEDEYQPRWLAKDEIRFNSEQMAWTGDVNTPVHEILGHAFTEAIGKGNKMTYGGVGSHDDPWQPAFKERSLFNPARWFGGKTAALSEDKAKGMALSEGWAQYVGDKWDRELKNIPDGKSELTTTNAQKEIANRKDRVYGKLYSEEGYGAKVENVVGTVFNEIYKGKSLEEAVADFAAVRKEFKRIHNSKSFQTINQFIYQKLDMVKDGLERQRIEKLIEDLVLG